MKYAITIAAVLFLIGCSRHEDAAAVDSILTKPSAPSPVQVTKEDTSGLVIDSFVVRQQPDVEKLKRFDPKEVVAIYEAFRPLRKEGTSTEQIDSFLRVKKITGTELHAVLSEGDRLGWAGAARH